MDILKLLKQLHGIAPDRNYTLWSRNAIVTAPQSPRRPAVFVWQAVVKSLEFGSAIALASLLLLIVVGGFSLWEFLSPFSVRGLDPTSLQAEAQAIDIQIQLTNLAYSEPSITPASTSIEESTVKTVVTPKLIFAKERAVEEAQQLGIKSPSASSSNPSDESIGLDQAFQELSK